MASSTAPPAASSVATADPPASAAAFIPLEANPELMTALLGKLGLSPTLAVHDVYSLTDADMLAFVPRPALALLLVFPVSAAYESARLAEDALLDEYKGKGEKEPVVWFRQTIRNACGLMGLLHAVSNGPARTFIEPDSTLSSLLSRAIPLGPHERSRLVETSAELATAHAAAASGGDTAAPPAEDDVDLHYVCFVKAASPTSGEDAGPPDAEGEGTLWELDGRRKGPLPRTRLGKNEDVLSEKALLAGPLKFLEREGGDVRFSCVALAGSLE